MNTHCCISHEFRTAVSNNPAKIAVIHSAGFRKVHNGSDCRGKGSGSPPVYEGDQCFTFSQLLAVVDCLSSRFRHILDGGGDPSLIKPRGEVHNEEPRSTQPMVSLNPNVHGSAYMHMYFPKLIGIYMVPSVEYIVTFLAVMRCGEAFIPLDPSWPRGRLLSIIVSSSVDFIVCSRSSFGTSSHQQLDSHWLANYSNSLVVSISLNDSLEEHTVMPNLIWPCENEKSRLFCYLTYTSGSTGKPKGVCGTEQGLLNRFLWMRESYPLHGEEVLLFKTSISFVDHLQELLGAILTASTLVIPPFNELQENIFCLVDFLKAYSIKRLIAVPTLMRALLPSLEYQHNMQMRSSLRLLVLSGEVFPLSLWVRLSTVLPETSIVNFYGSTEVSGDCAYFDCQSLPTILKTEKISSVPIGTPILNCDIVLVEDGKVTDQGEIHVGGLCLCAGHLYDTTLSSDYVKLPQGSTDNCTGIRHEQYYFKTGDFAKRLLSGDLVFLGRKDRSLKINGQRIALEEIESTLREHPGVVDAAVVSCKSHTRHLVLEAFLVLENEEKLSETSRSIRNWVLDKLPSVMIPSHFFFIESLPISPTGKVDYALLARSNFSRKPVRGENDNHEQGNLLQTIKKVFCDALMVDEVGNDDNFFMIGGNSIAAAHASYNLGINMRLLYEFPNPSKLQMALLGELTNMVDTYEDASHEVKSHSHGSNSQEFHSFKPHKLLRSNSKDYSPSSNGLKVSNLDLTLNDVNLDCWHPCISKSMPILCSYGQSNKVMIYDGHLVNDICQVSWSEEILRYTKGCIREMWRVPTESCVDASPILVLKDSSVYLYIGSHSRKFLCIDAKSGTVLWAVELEGRIECSAAFLGDFSQVVVGCYKGKIYFLNSTDGSIDWIFQTLGEVKSQPAIDKCRHLVWCGSYDHNLYALDYKNCCCVYKLPCGGSIFGSPAIDEVQDMLYVASTNGHVIAISLKASPFSTMWQRELGVPIFGSLSVAPNANVIGCLVDGSVVALDPSGSVIWQYKTCGPIFAGACISRALPSQVLVCSRNGSIYSFDMDNGTLFWEYNIGVPITASAYVDEHLQLASGHFPVSDRLICICSSSGTIYLLRVNASEIKELDKPNINVVQEFSRLDLQGDIFSSPVMVGGRIFVGCRDDYVHCIAVELSDPMDLAEHGGSSE